MGGKFRIPRSGGCCRSPKWWLQWCLLSRQPQESGLCGQLLGLEPRELERMEGLDSPQKSCRKTRGPVHYTFPLDVWRDFNVKWSWRIWNGESHACTLRRMERLISCECLVYRTPRDTSWSMNIHQGSLPILKPRNLLLGFCVDIPLFAHQAHKYSRPQALSGLTCSTNACISWIIILLLNQKSNSVSSQLNLPQFTSLFRLTVFTSSHKLILIFLPSEFSTQWLSLSLCNTVVTSCRVRTHYLLKV